MNLPIFNHSAQDGTIWSCDVSIPNPLDGFPKVVYIGERRVSDPDYLMHASKRGWGFSTLKIALGDGGWCMHNNKRSTIKKGQALLFNKSNPDFSHGIHDQYPSWTFLRLSFTGAATLVESINKRYGFIIDMGLNHKIVRQLKTFNKHAALHISMDANASAHLVWNTLSDIVRLHSAQSPTHPLCQQCLEWINQHIESDQSISDCARLLKVSQAYLTKIFVTSMGITPGAHLQQTRLQHALTLLTTTNEPIKSISSRCGYKNPSHFSRAISKFYGASPQHIRKDPGAWN